MPSTYHLLIDRAPLPQDHGPIDARDYRAFAEALPLSTLTAEYAIALMTDYAKDTGTTFDVLLVEALALQVYGYRDRLIRDAREAGSGD